MVSCATKTKHYEGQPADDFAYEPVEGETIETDVGPGYINPTAEALPGESSWSVTTTDTGNDWDTTTTETIDEGWATTPAGPAVTVDESWAMTPAGPPLTQPQAPIVRPGSVYATPLPPAPRTYPDYSAGTSAGYAGGGGGSYTVQRGDTLWGISRRYGTSVRALADANGLNPNGVLPVGKRLVIPGGSGGGVAAAPAAGGAAGGAYTVQRGDTLWGISRRYATTVDAIAAANGIDPNATLKIGQELKLP
jgi:LysM repeat protein